MDYLYTRSNELHIYNVYDVCTGPGACNYIIILTNPTETLRFFRTYTLPAPPRSNFIILIFAIHNWCKVHMNLYARPFLDQIYCSKQKKKKTRYGVPLCNGTDRVRKKVLIFIKRIIIFYFLGYLLRNFTFVNSISNNVLLLLLVYNIL